MLRIYQLCSAIDELNYIKLNKKLKDQIVKDNPNYKDDIFNNKKIQIESDNCLIF